MFIHFHIVCVCVVLLCIDLHRFPIIKPRNFSFVFFSLSSRPLLERYFLSFMCTTIISIVFFSFSQKFIFHSIRYTNAGFCCLLGFLSIILQFGFVSQLRTIFSVPFAKSFAYNVRLVFVLFRLNIPLIYSVECSKPYW